MTKKHLRKRLGEAPPERPAPASPRERGIGAPPNPRKPRLVPDVHGNELKDLFLMFPDLPRPARPAGRYAVRRRRLR